MATLDRLHESIRWRRGTWGIPSRLLKVVDTLGSLPTLSRIPTHRSIPREGLSRPRISISVPDAYFLGVLKQLALYQYFLLETEAQWLYLTTSSSYVRTSVVLSVARRLGETRCYAGTPISAGRHRFASGANRLMSRDVVAKVLGHRRRWSRSDLEDLGLGKLAHGLGLPLQTLGTLDIDSPEHLQSLSDFELREHHHFRLKSGPLHRRQDVPLMKELHRRLQPAVV